MPEEQSKIVYFLDNTMYINVTNLCTNSCVFCLREISDTVFGENLWLKNENVTADKIIEEIKANSPESRNEIVFCGYGEPLIKLDIVLKVAAFIKENYPKMPVRVNTNGQASLIHKRNIVPELSEVIDKISVSLNAENADLYAEICQCKFEKEECYQAIKD
ncbi:MAG: TatD family nuclease-associated radical SAM protein, partial [Candidatus Gastranaerophilales bacterium]|nr:TatD family nuclease-associated radical SAM protein [Candidatus Gastranaerophilales bacterium]